MKKFFSLVLMVIFSTGIVAAQVAPKQSVVADTQTPRDLIKLELEDAKYNVPQTKREKTLDILVTYTTNLNTINNTAPTAFAGKVQAAGITDVTNKAKTDLQGLGITTDKVEMLIAMAKAVQTKLQAGAER